MVRNAEQRNPIEVIGEEFLEETNHLGGHGRLAPGHIESKHAG